MAKFILLFVVVFAALIILMRLFGAWMLRINELIKLLQMIKEMIETKLTHEEIQSVRAKLRSKEEHFSEDEIERLQSKMKRQDH